MGMDEPYAPDEIEALDAHEQQDQMFESGGYDEDGRPWYVWPMEFPPSARLSE